MNLDAQIILEKVKNLSVNELLTVQETIIQELRHKTEATTAQIASTKAVSSGTTRLRHAYRRTSEEIEASLAAIFTPVELAEIGKRDFSKIDLGPKSLSEMVNEDREDRF